jgi:hypothetical protein
MKLTPTRTFLLRQVDDGKGGKKDVVAHRGVKIEATNDEHRKLQDSFLEPYGKKKHISVLQ